MRLLSPPFPPDLVIVVVQSMIRHVPRAWDALGSHQEAWDFVAGSFSDALGWGRPGKAGYKKYLGLMTVKGFWYGCVTSLGLSDTKKRHKYRANTLLPFCLQSGILLAEGETLLEHFSRLGREEHAAVPVTQVQWHVCELR